MKNKQLPNEWKEVELGEILDYEQPTNYIVESTSYKDEYKTPVLTAGKSFILGYTNETKGVYNKLPVIIFDDFTTENKFVDFKFKVKSSAMKLLRPKNKLINLKFVFLAIQRIKFDSKRHKRYYLSAYQNLKIPLPPFETQKKIVSILEKVEGLKRKKEEAIKLSAEYLKSVFYEMFLKEKNKFEMKRLEDASEIIMGQSPPGDSYNENGKGIPFFQGKAGFTDKYPVIKKWTTEPSKLAEPDSILISVRAPVGDVNLCNIKCCIGRGLASIKPIKELTNLYYLYFLLQNIKDRIEYLGSGSTFKAINSKQLIDIKIPLPPLSLQQKFASLVERFEKIKEMQKQNKDKIDNLFNSLMQRAFNGELVN